MSTPNIKNLPKSLLLTHYVVKQVLSQLEEIA